MPHVYIKDGTHYFINEGKEYTYEKGIAISNICILPQLPKFLRAKKFSTYKHVAEIGVRYGSSSRFILDNFENLSTLDLYEYNLNFIEIIKDRLKDYSKYNLYEGDARDTLKTNSQIYDLVFFDCSHIYDIDIEIFKQLIPHINKSTLLIFDDFYLADVKKLIAEVKQLIPNRLIY